MAKVLLVDDDKAGLDLRKLILEREGHQISTASDPVRARELFAEFQPSCIVMDLRLPESADGLSLIRDFRSASPSVRIIALCGWPPDIEGTPESQMVDTVLAKPTRTAALISALS
jgi:CheY-like chemotaxis protein